MVYVNVTRERNEEMWIVCIWVSTNSAPFDKKQLFAEADRGESLRIFPETDRRRGLGRP